jgi:formylglycine-generating enzyme required for sulfatase activity
MVDFNFLQNVYKNQMDMLLADNGLTTECVFHFGVTKKNLCPNCIFDTNLRKSSGKYKLGGSTNFSLGQICPYCNGIGFYGEENFETAYLAVIWDYKKWINPPPNINNPNGFIQTICDRTKLAQIKQCKDMTVVYSENNSNPLFRLYEEPNPAGLGDNNYLFCMWEKIGVSSWKKELPTPTPTETPTPTPTPIPETFCLPGPNYANYNNNAVWNGANGNVTTVGTNGGPSVYCTYDQGGNVSEWNDLDESISINRGHRGGSWNGMFISFISADFRYEVVATTQNSFIGFRIASVNNELNLEYYSYVTDGGNLPDSTGYGTVSQPYYISRYPVTNSEYTEFLNAVAKSDTYALFNNNMGSNIRGGISRAFFIPEGFYTYSVKNNMGNKPVNYVNWFDAARYCNWLHNGKPVGAQGNNTTESGAYALNGITSGNVVAKNTGAKYYIPSENQWYKSAYYKGRGVNSGYWSQATQSDDFPETIEADVVGNGPFTTEYE